MPILSSCCVEMGNAASRQKTPAKAILFNGPDPKDETKSLLMRYFPRTGVEEQVAQFDRRHDNSMAYLDGNVVHAKDYKSIHSLILQIVLSKQYRQFDIAKS